MNPKAIALLSIKEPRHGYGSGMNPCLDCRILMFSRARERMEEIGAAFVFTGKVGRHFRLSPSAKVVVGRNEEENRRLQVLAREADFRFEVEGCGSPVTLLRGGADGRDIH
jgi:tRNA U34 2-thiouridine synthase MnmA/TrmU